MNPVSVHRPGRDLAAGFYAEVVAALVDRPHAAAFLGWGSDVLGFDTERSTDHGFGPRLQIFVASRADVAPVEEAVDAGLPPAYAGHPVRFAWDDHPERHYVDVVVLADWLTAHLGFDATLPASTLDWLLTPQQLLLQCTAGAVFHDDLGELTRVRRDLAWYPDDVWRWLLACQWKRIAQEEAFVGRTAEVGDELGSRLIAGRLVRDLVRLAFLVERRYAPYAKWLGSAFAQLDTATTAGPALAAALAAPTHVEREAALVVACEDLARRTNALGLAPPVEPTARLFHTRPFRVIGGERFTTALLATVADDELRTRPPLGGIDGFVDSTDVLSHAARSRLAAALLGAPPETDPVVDVTPPEHAGTRDEHSRSID